MRKIYLPWQSRLCWALLCCPLSLSISLFPCLPACLSSCLPVCLLVQLSLELAISICGRAERNVHNHNSIKPQLGIDLASLEASHERNRSSNISSGSSGSNSRGSGSLGLSNAHWQSVAAWRYLQTTDDLMSSIDDQSSLLARLLPDAARLSLLTWSRSMASTTQRLVGPRSYVMLYGYLISAEQCISHGQLGSGRAWSGLQLATFSVDSTHIKIDGRQQCLCLCLYECIYVCVCVCVWRVWRD